MCYDFTDMSLVAMLRSNTLNSPQLYATCKWFFNYIKQQGGNAYFTVENNGIGEGFIALYESDESFPEGIDFITEAEGNRLGFRTEGRSKLRMCLTFKQLVEAGKIDKEFVEDRYLKIKDFQFVGYHYGEPVEAPIKRAVTISLSPINIFGQQEMVTKMLLWKII